MGFTTTIRVKSFNHQSKTSIPHFPELTLRESVALLVALTCSAMVHTTSGDDWYLHIGICTSVLIVASFFSPSRRLEIGFSWPSSGAPFCKNTSRESSRRLISTRRLAWSWPFFKHTFMFLLHLLTLNNLLQHAWLAFILHPSASPIWFTIQLVIGTVIAPCAGGVHLDVATAVSML